MFTKFLIVFLQITEFNRRDDPWRTQVIRSSLHDSIHPLFSHLLRFLVSTLSSQMTSMSIPSSIRSIKIKPNFKILPNPNLFLKPLISSFPHHSFTSFKSITFQTLNTTKPQFIPNSSSSSSSSSLQSIEELPPKLQDIVKLFQSADNPRAKYQQLLFYANNLPQLDEKYKTKENKVEGCVSQVWVRAFLGENSKDKVYYEADSDSVMTKGLAALLVLGLSGQPITEIVRVTPDFVTLLGLQQNLTPSRNNGFLNMLRLMQRKALFLGLEAEKQGSSELGSEVSSAKDGIGGGNELNVEEMGSYDSSRKLDDVGGVHGEERSSLDDVGGEIGGKWDDGGGVNGVERSSHDYAPSENGGKWDDGVVNGLERSSLDDVQSGIGGRGERIREVLERELSPVKLEIEDVSYQHAGHAGVRGSDGETHFNLKIVCNEFEGKSMVKRHRIIYGLLQDELQSGLHALSIVAKTPSEAEEGS